jgi:hypothetical protein
MGNNTKRSYGDTKPRKGKSPPVISYINLRILSKLRGEKVLQKIDILESG